MTQRVSQSYMKTNLKNKALNIYHWTSSHALPSTWVLVYELIERRINLLYISKIEKWNYNKFNNRYAKINGQHYSYNIVCLPPTFYH